MQTELPTEIETTHEGPGLDLKTIGGLELPSTMKRGLSVKVPPTPYPKHQFDLLRFTPLLQMGKVLTGFELINSNAPRATFASTIAFEAGTHDFILQHFFHFKDVEVGVMSDEEGKTDTKPLFSVQGFSELRLRLCMSTKRLTAYCGNSRQILSLPFTFEQCRVIVSLADTGNWLVLNTFSRNCQSNAVIAHVLETNQYKLQKKLDEWTFLTEFTSDVQEFVSSELKTVAGEIVGISSHFYDFELQVLAFKCHGGKKPQSESRFNFYPQTFCDKKDQPNALHKFCTKYRLELLYHSDPTTAGDALRELEILKVRLRDLKANPKEPADGFTLKYVSAYDALLISNNSNKFKMIYERDSQGEFVVSPYTFETSTLSFQLEVDELRAFLCQIDWPGATGAATPLENLFLLCALTEIRESLLRVGDHVFFLCREKFVESMLLCLMRTLQTVEVVRNAAEKPEEELSPDSIGLSSLFAEEAGQEEYATSAEAACGDQKTSVNHVTAFDVARNVLLRLEEALFQQSVDYAERLKFTSRPNSSYYRLASFATAHVEERQLSLLLDLGGYFDPFTQTVRAFYNPHKVISCKELGLETKSALLHRECVPLLVSLTHKRPQIVESGILLFELICEGRLLAVVDRHFTLRLYSLGFGATPLFATSLTAQEKTERLPPFASLLTVNGRGLRYFGYNEASRHRPPPPAGPAPPKPDPIERERLEQLYKLGFNVELCKKALLEVSGDAPEIGLVLDCPLPPHPNDPLLPLLLVPPHDQLPPLLPDAHLWLPEDKRFGKKTSANVESSADVCSARLIGGEKLMKLLGFFVGKESQLNSIVLMLFYRAAEGENRMLTLRLAYSPKLLSRLLLVDGLGECPVTAWLGKTPLQPGKEEMSLSVLMRGEFFDRLHGLLPLLGTEETFLSAERQDVEVAGGFCVEEAAVAVGEGGEEVKLTLFNAQGLLRVSLLNQSQGYDQWALKACFGTTTRFDTARRFHSCVEGVFLLCGERRERVNPLTLEVEEVDEGKITAEPEQTLSSPALLPVACEEEASPRQLLQVLGGSDSCPVSLISKENLVVRRHVNPFTHCLLSPCDSSSIARLTLSTKPSAPSLNLLVEAIFALPAETEVSPADDFGALSADVRLCDSKSVRHLPLLALEELQGDFSQVMPLSNVLFADAEPFATRQPVAVFAFESALQRRMEVNRLSVWFNDSFCVDGVADDVLCFVFERREQLGELQRFAGLTRAQYAELWRQRGVEAELRPAVHIDFAALGGPTACVDFRPAKTGKFVALVPLLREGARDGSKLFILDRFSVQGGYASEGDRSEHECAGNGQTLCGVPELFVNGVDCSREFGVVRVLEGKEKLVCARACVQAELNAQGAIELQLAGSFNSLSLSFAHCPAFPLSHLRPALLRGDSSGVEELLLSFCKRAETGQTAPFPPDEFIRDLVHLLQRLSELCGEQVLEGICAAMDWNKALLRRSETAQSPALARLFELLLEKGGGGVACRLRTGGAGLPSPAEAVLLPLDRQRLLWSVLRGSLRQSASRIEALVFLAQTLSYLFERVHTLHTPELKTLSLLGEKVAVSGCLTNAGREGIHGDGGTGQGRQCVLSAQTLMLSEKTFNRHLFSLKSPARVERLLCRLGEKTALQPFTLEVFALKQNGAVEVVAVKHFGLGFCHQAKKGGVDVFGLELGATGCLFCVVVRFNPLSSFRYSALETPAPFSFAFSGQSMQTQSPPWAQQLFTRLCGSLAKGLEVKETAGEWELPEEQESVRESPTATHAEALKAFKQSNAAVAQRVDKLSAWELLPSTALQSVFEQRRTAVRALTCLQLCLSHKHSEDIENINYWAVLAAEFVSKALSGLAQDEIEELLLRVDKNRLGLLLFCELEVAEEHGASSLRSLRGKLLHSLEAKEKHLLLEHIISDFLEQSDALFAAGVESFVEKLWTTGFPLQDWKELSRALQHLLAVEGNERQFALRLFLLAKGLEGLDASKPQPLLQLEIVRLLRLGFERGLAQLSPGIAAVLVKLTRLFLEGCFAGGSTEQLGPLLCGLADAKQLAQIEKPLGEICEDLRPTLQHAQRPLAAAKMSGVISLCTALVDVLQKQMVGKQSQQLIEFCLKHLIELVALFPTERAEEDKEQKLQFLPLELIKQLFLLVAAEPPSRNGLLRRLVELVQEEELGVEVFEQVAVLIFTLEEEQSQATAELLLEKVSRTFISNKNKTFVSELGCRAIEFVARTVFSRRQALSASVFWTEFCTQLCLLTLNLPGSPAYSHAARTAELLPRVFLPVFRALATALTAELNLGGADNFFYASREQIAFLELTTHLAFALQKAGGGSRRPLAEQFLEDFCGMGEEARAETQKALHRLIAWLMINSNVALYEHPTPAGSLLKQLFNSCSTLFRLCLNDPRLGVEVVDGVCGHLRRLHFALRAKAQANAQGYMSLLLAENVRDFIGNLVEELGSSPALLSRFARENDGLTLVFTVLTDWLGPAPAAPAGVLDALQLLGRRRAESDSLRVLLPPMSVRDKLFFEAELGNRMQMFHEDRNLLSSLVRDWQAGKKGSDQAVYIMPFPFSRKQVRLRFKLVAPAHVRNVKLGLFLQRWEKQVVLGLPAYVRLNVLCGEEGSQRLSLGEMRRVEDTGYAGSVTAVYVLNLDQLVGEDYVAAVAMLREHVLVHTFELIVGRPIVSVVDKISPIFARCSGLTNLSISFISVEGFTPTKVDIAHSCQSVVRKTFLRALEALFDSDAAIAVMEEHLDAMEVEARDALFALIEGQLPHLIANFTPKLVKFLLVVAGKSPQLAGHLFRALLPRLTQQEDFYVLAEALMRVTHQHAMLVEFFKHGAAVLAQGAERSSEFLEVLCGCLLAAERESRGKGDQGFFLPMNRGFYRLLVERYAKDPNDWPCERCLALLPCLLSKGAVRVGTKNSSLTGNSKELAGVSEELTQWMMEVLRERVKSGETVFLCIWTAIVTQNRTVCTLFSEEELVSAVAEAVAAQGPHCLHAHKALQTLCVLPEFRAAFLVEDFDQKLMCLLERHIAQSDWSEKTEHTSALLQSLFVLCGEERLGALEERFFGLLRSHSADRPFINQVLQGLLGMERTRNIQFLFSPEPPTALRRELSPARRLFALESSTLSPAQQGELERLGLQAVDEKTARLLASNSWVKAMEGCFTSDDFRPELKRKLHTTGPFLLVAHCLKEPNNTPTPMLFFSPAGFKEASATVSYTENTPSSFICVLMNEATLLFKSPVQRNQRQLEFSEKNAQFKAIFAYNSEKKAVVFPLERELCQYYHELEVLWPTESVWGKDKQHEDICFQSFELFLLEVSEPFSDSPHPASFHYQRIVHRPPGSQLLARVSSIFSDPPVFALPAELTLQGLQQCLKTSIRAEGKQRRLADFDAEVIPLACTKPIFAVEKAQLAGGYAPVYPVLESFVRRGGLAFLLKTILAGDVETVAGTAAERVRRVLAAVLGLAAFPGLFPLLAANKDFYAMVFELLVGEQPLQRDWARGWAAVAFLVVQTVHDLLQRGDESVWESCHRLDVLGLALDFLRDLSGEPVRRRVSGSDPIAAAATRPEALAREGTKRRGVGYDKENSGESWIVSDYLARLKRQSEQLVAVLALLRLVLGAGEGDVDRLCLSCLLPLMESTFKNTSLQEMAKDAELHLALYDLVLVFARREALQPLLQRLPAEYLPPQPESVLEALLRQEESLRAFKGFAELGGAAREKGVLLALAEKTLAVITEVKAALPREISSAAEQRAVPDLAAISRMSVNQRYHLALGGLLFGLTDMRLEGKLAHFYASQLEEGKGVSLPDRNLRLAQEVTTLTASLPADSFNAIFVRCDASRLDIIKALVAGAEGTPYANGLFEYHLLLPPSYPFAPPLCNLHTTGGGDVRFNPNLYACGKVCLSLLGTWRGHASENWDPKISNVLQLLLSLQSMVMSEEVYFNEPGFEHEIGSEAGDSKNEAYSNIVRLCNVKYAMLAHIRRPPAGFEEAVQRHFYVKREVVLRECGEWLRLAETRKAAYVELVLDHNHSYGMRFNLEPEAYAAELRKEVAELEQVLQELVLNTDIQRVYFGGKATVFPSATALPAPSASAALPQEQIDIGYEEEVVAEAFDVAQPKVTDRWSRHIGVLGLEAVRRQAQARVLLVGLGGAGLETAKNLALSGFNRLVLADWETICTRDFPGLFYAEEAQIGVNRATAILRKLQQLNPFVRMEARELRENEDWAFVAEFDVIVVCRHFPPVTTGLFHAVRAAGKSLVLAETCGVFGRVFCDFGDEFLVEDKDDEQPIELYLTAVDYTRNRLVLAAGSRHALRGGDAVRLLDTTAEADPALQSLEGAVFTLTESDEPGELAVVESLLDFERFDGSGKVREVKKPLHLRFKPFQGNGGDAVDQNLSLYDFGKANAAEEIAQCFSFRQSFEAQHAKHLHSATAEEFHGHNSSEETALLRAFALLSGVSVPAVAALVGGLAAQETIKAVTRKFKPIHQTFYYDCRELLPAELTGLSAAQFDQRWTELGACSAPSLSAVLGDELWQRVRDANAFIVGAGAIGCELLKNMALWGVGSGSGRLSVTDPDTIELSNLSRQFLFREKHIAKSKALVAARAVEALSSFHAAEQVRAHTLKLCPQAEDVFDERFFAAQQLCLNALDNIPARLYADQRCVQSRVPLLESGTLGAKGHVQVIVPFLTESYGQVRDPAEEGSIPLCTLRMFPEEPNHCIEWAKEAFDDLFGQRPKALLRVAEESQRGSLNGLDPKLLRLGLKLLRKKPASAAECVLRARQLFQRFFANNIRQLLSVYPADFRGKDGKAFWALPRRRPQPIDFDPAVPTHLLAVKSAARLLARVWGVDASVVEAVDVAAVTAQIPSKPFKPKDSAATHMRSLLRKEEGGAEAEEESSVVQSPALEEIRAALPDSVAELVLSTLREEPFEKDTDANGHIDFIAAFANLRAANYSLPATDWISVKLRAGRITPALATTTAVVAALQSIEAVKVLKGGALELYRNTFLNLALPLLTMSEPGPPPRHSLSPQLQVTIWDVWEYGFSAVGGDSLGELFAWVEQAQRLQPTALLKGAELLYMQGLSEWAEARLQQLSALLALRPGESVNVQVICCGERGGKPLENVPPVRVAFHSG